MAVQIPTWRYVLSDVKPHVLYREGARVQGTGMLQELQSREARASLRRIIRENGQPEETSLGPKSLRHLRMQTAVSTLQQVGTIALLTPT